MMHPTPQRGGTAVLVAVLALLTALAPLSVDMYLPAMPRLAAAFAVAPARVQYSLSLFFIGMALGQLAYGPLSDRYGRRPVLFFGICLYLAATVACALSATVDALIAARAVQGVGAAAGPVMARAVVRDRFHGARAASVMSYVVMVMAGAPMVAPVVGGLVLAVADWHAIFWVLFGYAAVSLAALAMVLSESHPPARRTRDRGLAAQYLGYLSLLGRPSVVLFLVCGGLMFGALFTYVGTSAFVYIEQFGVPESTFGFYFGANVLALIVGSYLNGRLVTRFGYLALLGVAVANTLTCSLVLLATTATGFGGFWGVAVPLFFLLSTVGVAGANTVAGMLDLVPDSAGAVSALFGVCQFGCGALASWLAGALGGHADAMAAVMSLCAAGSVAAYAALRRPGALQSD
ncbi:Bcr/CflA subfamily transporter [Salinisphaera sp. PC39]|uniref:Bcr/CflA family multidrug efflux MFS transporter n=1 Tax=Salinisphaera sp. PC39 TaxID=1304156 RepID=UPI00334095C2